MLMGEAAMPATILRFERRDSVLATRAQSADAEGAPEPAVPPSLTMFRPRLWVGTAPTSRQIAHRWAMLSHLSRHFPRPPGTVR
jgi:hypothetical protein